MDTSRQALDPAGGTGWVRPAQAAFNGGTPPPQPTYSCTPGSDGVILYERPNFDTSGGCWTITANTTSLDGFPGANDNIRSIQIKGRYTVTLYEHPGFSGQPEVFTTHDSDLTANDIGNRTSSVKIEAGGCDAFGEGVTLFAQTNWDGICSTVTSDVSDLSTLLVGSDRTHSIRIRGPYKAELFRDPGFTGVSETILTDEPDLSNNVIGNTASSIRVTRLDCDKEGEGVTLFANRNFDGACWTFTADSSNIGPTGLNDSVFSIRIKGPYRAQIYEHPGFSGRDVVQTWEDNDLSNDVFGNGTSSIRVWRYNCNPETEGVVLFAQPNYGGICQAFTADDADIGADPIGNDDTYSVRINGPYRATLYVDPGFSGSPQTIIAENTPDLRATAIGNRTSSLRVVRTKHDLSVTRLGVAGGSITASPAGVNCGPTCTFQYDVGATVTLNAVSDGVAEFAGWGGACSGTGPCTVTMDANKAVTATFVQAHATLTVAKTGNGTGVVAAGGGGITCGSDCSESYLVGTVVTLSALVDTGSTFDGWSGACTGTGACVVTVDTAKSVTATFTVQIFSLTVVKAGAGSGAVTSQPSGIDCGATCTASFASGTSVTLTATPASGSSFAGWSGSCTGTATTCTVTMSQAMSVTATFSARNGSLVLAPISGSVAQGASLTLEITIDTGGHVLDGTDVILLYDPTKFSTNVGAIDTTGGVYASYLGKNVDQVNGKVSVSGIASIATGFTGSGRFARVTFTALPNATAGPTAVRFDFDPNNPAKTTDTNLVERGTIVDVLGSVTDGTYTIAAAPAGTIQLSVATLSVPESASTATLTVTRTGGSAGAISVGYATTDGTATAGNDYTSTSGTLSWADGESVSKSIIVPILNDSALEGDETFTVTLSNPTGGATLGTTTSTTVTISANDTTTTLTVTKAGTGSGTVTSSPIGINCGADCSEDYPVTTPATSVTLTAAAANGSTFAGWSGMGAPSTCTVTPAPTTCQVTMNAAKSVTATFNLVPSPVVGGHGFGITPGLTSVALSWTGGTAQAGYLLVRPPLPGWVLPPAESQYTDSAPAPGALNCYVLVPFNSVGAVLGNSDVLCAQTGVRSPTGAPSSLTLRLNESSTASLSWTPPGGQTGYYLLAIPLDGQPTRWTVLPAGATSTTDDTAGAFTCYVLFAALPSGTSNSDLVCGIPGAAQFPVAAAVGPASSGVGTSQSAAAAETASRTTQTAAATEIGHRTLRPLAERAAASEAELKRKIDEGRKKVEEVRKEPADRTPPSEVPRPVAPPVRPGRPGMTR